MLVGPIWRKRAQVIWIAEYPFGLATSELESRVV